MSQEFLETEVNCIRRDVHKKMKELQQSRNLGDFDKMLRQTRTL